MEGTCTTERASVWRRLARSGAVVILALHLAPGAVAAGEPRKVAVFDLELLDTSYGTAVRPEPDAAHQERLQLITEEVRGQLDASDQYEVVSLDPAREAIAAAGYMRQCNGCEVRIARDLGTDLALVGWVHKVSNLILSINLRINDVQTGEVVFLQSADIRGDTDESWLHGTRWLLRNRLLSGSG